MMGNWRRVVPGLFLVVTFLGMAPEPAQAAPSASALLPGPWHGSYVCNQGITRMRLTLTPVGGGRVNAEFAFAADPDNPSVPQGSFALSGTFDAASGRLVLRQDKWLQQPADPSYRMIDLEGQLTVRERQALIRGRITSYGCQDFSVWQFFDEVRPEPTQEG